MNKLTDKQQLFVTKYLEFGLNATKAAKEAGYSDKTARSQGARLLTNVDIRAAIDAELSKHAMSAHEVIYHITAIARGDMRDLVDQNGNLDMERAEAAMATGLIKRVKNKVMATGETEINEGEIEAYDRLKALELLARYHQILTTKIQIDDWRSQAIADIKAGIVSYEALVSAFDSTLATELFAAAGISVQISESASE